MTFSAFDFFIQQFQKMTFIYHHTYYAKETKDTDVILARTVI